MANKKESKEPNSCMALNTIVMSPAAGPETPSLELESSATTVPPKFPLKHLSLLKVNPPALEQM